MIRTSVSFPITDFNTCKQQLFYWANRFDVCCLLDNHQYSLNHHSYECLVAAGAQHSIKAEAGTAFNKLQQFINSHDDWLFGHFSYDLKNELEELSSGHPDGIQFPDLFFFIPEFVIFLNQKEMTISTGLANHRETFRQISGEMLPEHSTHGTTNIQSRLSKEEYLRTIFELRQHILRGDCYEINFCQEFYAEEARINPLAIYQALTGISPNPFSAFYKVSDQYLCCASPERYLKKEGQRIITQPIKGTMPRHPGDGEKDTQSANSLLASGKERSENVMIVDLARNDLSRICEEGSVNVDELFGIYSFPQVHQMVSTISGLIKKDVHLVEVIKATFPMGSMTGAPKKRVMELIEKYEKTKRGLFSGAVGYITPGRDFDFNVVIRSILYNQLTQYLSYQVGSGITFNSDPMQEYEECMLKASAIKKVLQS